jgi:hypothetical protein
LAVYGTLDCFYIGFGNNASIDEESFISALMLPVRETRVTWCLGSKALATAAPIVPVPPMMTIFMEDF